MSSQDRFSAQFDRVRRSHAEGRLAHAFVIVGSPQETGFQFAEAMIRLVLGPEVANVRQHPDVLWVEPQKKSRVIDIDSMREVNKFVSQKSYVGGWKVIAIMYADRFNESSANAFLKTLEEPPPKTLILLLTHSPQALLTTIASRCQRVDLDAGEAAPQGAWVEPVLELLRRPGTTALGQAAWALSLSEFLAKEKKRIQDETEAPDEMVADEKLDAYVEALVKQRRSDVLRVILLWHRDLLALSQGGEESELMFPAEAAALRSQMAGKTVGNLLGRLRAVEEMARRLERNLPDMLVFESFALANG